VSHVLVTIRDFVLTQEHGLQATTGGVVQLKCDKRQEALSYGDTEPHFEGANLISRLCHSLPIHLVFGARDDPVFVLKCLRSPLSLVIRDKDCDVIGRTLSSIPCVIPHKADLLHRLGE
jgi:hypothetical protein